jgi:hypothetical protein
MKIINSWIQEIQQTQKKHKENCVKAHYKFIKSSDKEKILNSIVVGEEKTKQVTCRETIHPESRANESQDSGTYKVLNCTCNPSTQPGQHNDALFQLKQTSQPINL